MKVHSQMALSKKIAFSAIIAALSVVFLYIGSISVLDMSSVVVCALLLGKGVDGTGSATSEGIQATALVAMIFVGCALCIYFFYNDKEISETIRKANEEQEGE